MESLMLQSVPARLVLADGSIHAGLGFGATGESGGEVVFNTSLLGYQEIITDPSYCGQIVVMTSPLMGNYGINAEDDESDRPYLSGFVIRELSPLASNFRHREELGIFLERHGIVAIEGVDTRNITKRLRTQGALKGLLSTDTCSDSELLERLHHVPELEGRDLVSEVTRGKRMVWEKGYDAFQPKLLLLRENLKPHVVVLDFGAKSNILRSLVSSGFRVTVLPADATASDVLAESPDGVLLSNGPGDPRVLAGPIATVQQILGKVPIFGICLGHQILAAAIGASVYKLKFGHHGGNQPVLDLTTNKVEITSQNHGFAVEESSIERVGWRVTHRHLNDGTVSGMANESLMAMSVQYHPEAAPGPRDSTHLFLRFRDQLLKRVESV
jgi:carbamoyl-phosphate synthase small subunit